MHFASVATLIALAAIAEARPVVQQQQQPCDITDCAIALAKGTQACGDAVERRTTTKMFTSTVLRAAICVQDALNINAPPVCQYCHEDIVEAAKQLKLCVNGAPDDLCANKANLDRAPNLLRRANEQSAPPPPAPLRLPPPHLTAQGGRPQLKLQIPSQASPARLPGPEDGRIAPPNTPESPFIHRPGLKLSPDGKPIIGVKFDETIFDPNHIPRPPAKVVKRPARNGQLGAAPNGAVVPGGNLIGTGHARLLGPQPKPKPARLAATPATQQAVSRNPFSRVNMKKIFSSRA